MVAPLVFSGIITWKILSWNMVAVWFFINCLFKETCNSVCTFSLFSLLFTLRLGLMAFTSYLACRVFVYFCTLFHLFLSLFSFPCQENMKFESINFFELEILILTFQGLVMSVHIFNSSLIV